MGNDEVEPPHGPIDRSLELDGEAMRERVALVMGRLVRYVDSLPQQPAGYRPEACARAQDVRRPLPSQASSLEGILDELFERCIPPSFNAAGPGYLAYVPGGGLFDSALGSFVAAVVNRYTGVWAAAPFLVELETDVLRWFAQLMGYPDTARGLLTSGGSLATFTAIVTARRERLPDNFLDGVIYVGDQAHHCIAKSAMLAGFPARSLVVLPSDDHMRLSVDALAAQIARDRTAGRRPFLVTASAGTTNTGAVDDLDGIAALCQRERLWLHVDAAYGGFFRLTETGREALSGLERADSIVLDPHKTLFLPFGTGAVLIRDGAALRRAHSVEADYLPPMQGEDDGRVDPCEYGPELSRPYRGLAVWLPLMLHGVEPFRRYLDEKLELARYAAERLRAVPGIEIAAEPELSILAFRLVRAGLDVDQLNQLNRRLLAGILERDRVWLTSTMLGDRFVIRIAIVHFRTHRDRVDACLDDIEAAITAV